MFFCEKCERWSTGKICVVCGDDCIVDPSTPTNDPVNSPSHYTHGGVECIDAVKSALGDKFMGFLIGNVMKYVYRYEHKNGLEDLKKARWYLDRAIKEMER